MSPKKKTKASGSPSTRKAAKADMPAEPAVQSPGTEDIAEVAEPEAAPDVVFTYKPAGGAIAIFWHGRQVKTVGGAVGARLRFQLADADEATAQQLLARASGNFKRGTERSR